MSKVSKESKLYSFLMEKVKKNKMKGTKKNKRKRSFKKTYLNPRRVSNKKL